MFEWPAHTQRFLLPIVTVGALVSCSASPTTVSLAPHPAAPPAAPIATARPTSSAIAPSSAPPNAAPSSDAAATVPTAVSQEGLPPPIDVTTNVPEGWVFDGAIDEWHDTWCTGRFGLPPARTCVYVALSTTELIVSGRLGKDATDGVWFRLQPGQDVLHPQWGSIYPDRDLTCDDAPKANDRKRCDKVHEIERSLMRDYHVTATRVLALGPTGEMAPVKGAEIKFAKSDQGEVTFEVRMSINELPLINARRDVDLGGCVALEPSKLGRPETCERSMASLDQLDPKAAAERRQAGGESPATLSYYKVGSPNVTICQRDHDSVDCKTLPLFDVKAENDKVRVGLAPAFRSDETLTFVPVIETKGGDLFVQEFSDDFADALAVVKRANAIHIIKAQKKCGDEACAAIFSLYRVNDEGHLEGVSWEGKDERLFGPGATIFHEGAWTSFGIRGTSVTSGKPKPVEVRFSYDTQKDGYKVVTR